MMYGFMATVLVVALAVTIGAWLRREKDLWDWMMAIGGSVVVVGVVVILVIVLDLVRMRNEDFIVFGALGAIGTGLLMFAMGYVMDRLRLRREEDHRHEIPRC